MDFSESERVQGIRGIVRDFMKKEVYPLEPAYRARGFAAVLPELGAKRAKAKETGLWAAHLAVEWGGAGLSLLEFAHPACALVGLACWLGFTLIHNRALGWIAFALIAVTACVGLAWFTVNVRAARHGGGHGPAPSFAGRLVVLHGCAAAVTITLAALTALVTRG